MTAVRVRQAQPADAAALVELAEAVGSEPEGWLISESRWRRRNLYFGGVSAVEVGTGATLAAAGDPRRGGRGIVVE